jgi:Fic family protein
VKQLLSQTGDWDRWIGFFAAGVEESADTTRRRVESLLAWREQTLERVRAAGASGVAERVAGELIGGPIVRAPAVAKRHGVSPQGAMVALRRLAELGVLHEQRVRGRVTFVARDALALLQA